MQIPLQITFRNTAPSEALEAKIRSKVEKLERIYKHINSCRVVVDLGHRHHHQGNIYHVAVDLTVPDGELAVSHEAGLDHAHEDAHVAVRDAFAAMQRKLERYAERRRGHTKQHEKAARGRVCLLDPEQGFGTIETPDGREVYFNANSLVEADFKQLRLGSELRFVEEMGEKGPQTSSVRVIGKHHPV